MISRENYSYELKEIFEKFKSNDVDKVEVITNLLNKLIQIDERLSYTEIYKFISNEYYSNSKKDVLEGFILFLSSIQLESSQKQIKFDKIKDYFSLEVARFIEKDKLKEQEVRLQKVKTGYNDLIGKLNIELEELKEKTEDIDKKSLEKLGLFIAMFSLIASNISILYKGTDLQPELFLSIIFIVNGTLILGIQTIFKLIGNNFSKWCFLIPLLLEIVGIILFTISKCF